MDVLEIEVNGEFLELYQDEKIVQSISVLNISDITKRFSEYTNEFKIPKTNANIRAIEYSDFVVSNSEFPFRKNQCTIYINGFPFKRGYIQLTSISDDIYLRFYTGNIGFYNALKDKKLNQLRLSTLDHTWNLTTVIASRNNDTGYIYPIIDYNGISNTGNSVDVRRLLPAYFDSTLMEACCTENGYTLDNQINAQVLSEYNDGIVPSTKKNPTIPQEILDANLYEGQMYTPVNETDFGQAVFNLTSGQSYVITSGYQTLKAPYEERNPSNLYGAGSQSGGIFQYGTGIFTCGYAGNYKITSIFDYDFYFTEQWTSSPNKQTNINLTFDLLVNGNYVATIEQDNYSTTQTFPTEFRFTGSVNGEQTIYLNVGDQLTLSYRALVNTVVASFSGAVSVFVSGYLDTFQTNSQLLIELQPDVVFGQPVTAQYFLPEISQSDYFKDTCIRYCLMPFVNEDTKVVTLIPFSQIKSNIGNAVDWSNKIDETNEPKITFDLSEYAQKNTFKHKEDKSIEVPIVGSDYILNINNANLEPEKDIYTSPFAASEMVTRLNDFETIYINLHDGTNFTLDVEPRRAYVEKISKSIDYTDGTTTINVTTNIPACWFIRDDKTYNMGFGNNQMLRYSSDLISVLQFLRVINIDIRLNLLDILNLNYLYPIYLDKYNSYFFISSINQFDYTSNDATEVELIRLL